MQVLIAVKSELSSKGRDIRQDVRAAWISGDLRKDAVAAPSIGMRLGLHERIDLVLVWVRCLGGRELRV